MSVLIIGSGGYMGRRLLERLLASDINTTGVSSSDGSGIDPISGLLPLDYRVPKGTAAIVYMSQSPHYRDPAQASHVLSTNVLSVARAAVAARAVGVKRFIYISTGTVYAPSFHPLTEQSEVGYTNWYGLSKIQGEQVVQMFSADMDIHIVRPFGVYGPNQTGRLIPNLVNSIRKGTPITLQARQDDTSDADGLRISLCHIDDAITILEHLTTQGGPPILNLAGDCAPSIRSLSILLGELLGKTPVLVPAETPREFDLIADNKVLLDFLPMSFIPLKKGLLSAVTA